MTISTELNNTIEQEMAALTIHTCLRPRKNYSDFVIDYTHLLAQATKDQPNLVRMGFDKSLMPKYHGYLEKLNQIHYAREIAEREMKTSEDEYFRLMPKALEDKQILMAVGQYIAKKTKNTRDKHMYEIVRAGYGNIDILSDNVTMASLIQRHTHLTKQLRPGGRVIDAVYLEDVEAKAQKLRKLKELVNTARYKSMELADRHTRILSLCVQAEREIKLFAEMAYHDNMERSRYYTDTPANPPQYSQHV